MRAHGITTEITFQADRGQEFGGDHPTRIARQAPARSTATLSPGTQGLQRSHRTDDEEFYRPYLPHIYDVSHWVRMAAHGVY